jgi:hypothetical protein
MDTRTVTQRPHSRITVSPTGRRVWIGTEDGPGWNLPV